MKCVKKLVAVLLTAVMALTLLTACGGGGGGGGNPTNKGPFNFSYSERIAKTNDKLGEDGPKLTIDPSMADEVQEGLNAYQTAYMNALLNGKDEDEADKDGQAAMGKVAQYELFTLAATKNSDVNQLAEYLANGIRNDSNVNSKKDLKTVGGYADLEKVSGRSEYKGYYLIYVFVK